jgi:hypothetical protein
LVDEEAGLTPLDSSILESLREGKMRFIELKDRLNKTRPEDRITNDKLNDRLKSLMSYGYIRRHDEGHQKVWYELLDPRGGSADRKGPSNQQESTGQAMGPLLRRINIDAVIKESQKHIRETIDSFSRQNLFLEALYVERSNLTKAFQEFLAGPQVIFALVGETGLGKTSFLCKVSGEMQNDIVVFLQGGSLTDDPLSNQIMDRVAPSYSMDDLLESLASDKRRLVIIFDALNDYGPGRPERQRNLINEFNHLLYHSNGAKLKIIITSRPYSWRLVSDKLPRDKCYTTRQGLQYQLSRLEDAELEEAYNLYRGRNNLKTEFGKVSETTKRNMRTPGLLRMISEAYHDGQIPAIAPAEKVFDLYYTKVILRQDDIGTYPEDASRIDSFVKTLVEKMLSQRRGYMDAEEMNEVYFNARFRDSAKTILDGLLDSGFLKSGVGQFGKGYKFSYDWVFENLLAERIMKENTSYLPKTLLEYAKDARKFQYLYGALKSVLVRISEPGDYVKFAKSAVDNSDAQRIIIESILSLSDYFPEKAGAILCKLANENDDLCKEIAARSLAEMDDPNIEVQLKLIQTASERVFDVVLESVILSWYKSNAPYPPVLGALVRLIIDKFDARKPFEAALEISLRTITVTFMDPEKLTAFRQIWMDCFDQLMRNPKTFKNRIKKFVISAALTRVDPFIEGMGFQPNDPRLVPKSAGRKKVDQMLYLLKYLDEKSVLEGEDYEVASELAVSQESGPMVSLLVMSIISFNLAKHYSRDPEFVRRMLDSDDPNVRSATLACTLIFGRTRPDISRVTITDSLAEEIRRNPILYRGVLFDIFLQAQRDQDGRIPLAENLLKDYVASGMMSDFYYAVEELSKVGVLDPRAAALTLRAYANSGDHEIRRKVIAAVQRVRIKDPDILEKYFEDAPEEFKVEVRHMNNRLGMREFSIVEAYSFCGLFVPVFREYMIKITRKIADVDNTQELKKIFTNDVMDMLMDERLFTELLQAVSNKNRWFFWEPTLHSTRPK